MAIFCGICGQKIKFTKEEKEQAKLERQKIREKKRLQKLEDLKKTINENRQKTLETYRENSDIIAGVQILAVKNGGCEDCLKHDGEIFNLNCVPNLPIDKCTNSYGYCRCTYISVLKKIL